MKVRCIEDVLNDFAKAVSHDELVTVYGCTWSKMYKNQELRDNLRQEYISLLPVNQRLALYLATCLKDSFMYEMFLGEFQGIVDIWSAPLHKEFLRRANEILDVYAPDGKLSESDLNKLCRVLRVSHVSMPLPAYPYVLE